MKKESDINIQDKVSKLTVSVVESDDDTTKDAIVVCNADGSTI